MKKDKMVSIRINSEIKERIAKMGLSVQKIIDGWIEKTYEVNVQTVIKKKKKAQ